MLRVNFIRKPDPDLLTTFGSDSLNKLLNLTTLPTIYQVANFKTGVTFNAADINSKISSQNQKNGLAHF